MKNSHLPWDMQPKEFKGLNKDIKNDILLLHFNNLFSDLCELFIYAIIYSEKNIELKYIKKGEI